MCKVNGQMISIINDIIYTHNLESEKYKEVEWKEVFKSAEKKNLLPIIFKEVSNSEIIDIIDKETISEFKNKSATIEKENKKNLKKYMLVVNELKKTNIKFILTGSLISRELYLSPETISIDNIDILVSENDLDNVDNSFKSLGYVKFPKEANKKDIIYVNKNISVRVRWTLINDSFIAGKKLFFEEELLKEAREIEIENEKILATSLEDSLITLCLDMAEQVYYDELDLREVLDLVLLVVKYESVVDWKSFLNKSKKCGIYRFIIAIFTIGNKLFNMPIPTLINKQEKIEDKYIEVLIDELTNEFVDSNDNDYASDKVKINILNKTINKIKEGFKKLISNKGNNKNENLRDELLRELGL